MISSHSIEQNRLFAKAPIRFILLFLGTSMFCFLTSAQTGVRDYTSIDVNLGSSVIAKKLPFDEPFLFTGTLPTPITVKKIEYRYRISPNEVGLIYRLELIKREKDLGKPEIIGPKILNAEISKHKGNWVLELTPERNFRMKVPENPGQVQASIVDIQIGSRIYSYRFPFNSSEPVAYKQERETNNEKRVSYSVIHAKQAIYFPRNGTMDNQGYSFPTFWEGTDTETKFSLFAGAIQPNKAYEFEFKQFKKSGISTSDSEKLKKEIHTIVSEWVIKNDINNRDQIEILNSKVGTAVKGYVQARVVNIEGTEDPIDMSDPVYRKALVAYQKINREKSGLKEANKIIIANLVEKNPALVSSSYIPEFYEVVTKISSGQLQLNEATNTNYAKVINPVVGFETLTYRDLGNLLAKELNFKRLISGESFIKKFEDQSTIFYGSTSEKGSQLASLQFINRYLNMVLSPAFLDENGRNPFVSIVKLGKTAAALQEFENEIDLQGLPLRLKNNQERIIAELVGENGLLSESFDFPQNLNYEKIFDEINNNPQLLDDRSKAFLDLNVPIKGKNDSITYKKLFGHLKAGLSVPDLQDGLLDKLFDPTERVAITRDELKDVSNDILIDQRLQSYRLLQRFFEDLEDFVFRRDGTQVFPPQGDVAETDKFPNNSIAESIRNYVNTYELLADLTSSKSNDLHVELFYQESGFKNITGISGNEQILFNQLLKLKNNQKVSADSVSSILKGMFEIRGQKVVPIETFNKSNFELLLNLLGKISESSQLVNHLEKYSTIDFDLPKQAILDLLEKQIVRNIPSSVYEVLIGASLTSELTDVNLNFDETSIAAGVFLNQIRTSPSAEIPLILKKKKKFDGSVLVSATSSDDSSTIELFGQFLKKIKEKKPEAIPNLVKINDLLSELVNNYAVQAVNPKRSFILYEVQKGRLTNDANSLLYFGLESVLGSLDPTKLTIAGKEIWETKVDNDKTVKDIFDLLKGYYAKRTLHQILTGQLKVENGLIKTKSGEEKEVDLASIELLLKFYDYLSSEKFELKAVGTIPQMHVFKNEHGILLEIENQLRTFLSNLEKRNELDPDGSEIRQIDQALTNLYVQNTLLRGGASLIETNTDNTPYLGLDNGIGYATGLQGVFTYTGTNIYFNPVNKNTNFSSYSGFWNKAKKSFSFLVGITTNTGFSSTEYETLFDKNNTSLLVGGGLRVNTVLRVSYGGIIHKAPDGNPLIERRNTVFSSFVSVSFDTNLVNTAKFVTNLFSK